jgi:hypothetical protein
MWRTRTRRRRRGREVWGFRGVELDGGAGLLALVFLRVEPLDRVESDTFPLAVFFCEVEAAGGCNMLDRYRYWMVDICKVLLFVVVRAYFFSLLFLLVLRLLVLPSLERCVVIVLVPSSYCLSFCVEGLRCTRFTRNLRMSISLYFLMLPVLWIYVISSLFLYDNNN